MNISQNCPPTFTQDTPFVMPKKYDAYGQPLKSPDAWEGYCVDLLNLISKDVGFNYTIEIAKDGNYGSRHVTDSGEVYYDGTVGEVHRGVSSWMLKVRQRIFFGR